MTNLFPKKKKCRFSQKSVNKEFIVNRTRLFPSRTFKVPVIGKTESIIFNLRLLPLKNRTTVTAVNPYGFSYQIIDED